MSEKGFLRGIREAFSTSDNSSSASEDSKLLARRKFLQLAGVAAVAPVVPSDGAFEKIMGGVGNEAAKTAMTELTETAQKQILAGLGNHIGKLSKYLERRPNTSSRNKELFETLQTAKDLIAHPETLRKSIVQPEVVRRFETIRDVFNEQMTGLPGKMRMQDLLGTDIESAYESMFGKDTASALPGLDVRTSIVDRLKEVTGLDESATFDQVRKAYDGRVAKVTEEIFKQIDNPGICKPEDKERILEALRDAVPKSPEYSQLADTIQEAKMQEFAKNRALERAQMQKEAETESRERRENTEKREPVRAMLVASDREPGTFHLQFQVQPHEMKLLRPLEKTDVQNLLAQQAVWVIPGMFDMVTIPSGATIISKDKRLTELLNSMTSLEDPFLLPDRRHQEPLMKEL